MLVSNLNELKNQLESFNLLTGFHICIYNLDSEQVIGYPEKSCDFCRMIKNNPQSSFLCEQSDRSAFLQASTTGKTHLYSCPFGLYEAVVPLFLNDSLTGYLMIGQMARQSKETISQIQHLSLPYLKNEGSIIEKTALLPSMSLDKIYAALSILETCASRIVDYGWLKPDRYTLPYRIKEYIDQKYKLDIGIKDICDHTCYSRTHIIKSFKDEYGFSISKYIESKRLMLAVELLQTSDASISQIARQCGFNDQYYFSKVFKKVYGYTPTESRIANIHL